MRKLIAGMLLALIVAAGCSQPQQAATPLEVTVPWTDGEATTYVINDKQGNEVGTARLSARQSDGKWLLEQTIEAGATRDHSEFTSNGDDLKPIGEHRVINTGSGEIVIDTAYSGNKLSITAQTPDRGEQKAEIDVPADAYDNDQALFLWRTLPYADGYQATYTNIVAANALKPTLKLTTVGKESVSVPAGQFEAWKVEMEAGQQKQLFWVGTEAPHYLVQYDNGATVMSLSEHP